MADNDVYDVFGPDLYLELTLQQKLDNAGPREQIEILSLYADKQLGFIWYEALDAGELIHLMEEKRSTREVFDLFIEQTLRQFERRQFELNEEINRLLKVQGGKNSHGLSEQERDERNWDINNDYNLHKSKGWSNNRALVELAKKYRLDKVHIRKNIIKKP